MSKHMPELPEVETIRNGLQKAIVGKTISNVEVLKTKSFQGDKNQIVGRQVLSVNRRAKILLIELSGGICLGIHLKLTGQLIYRDTKYPSTSPGVGETRDTEEKKNGPFAIKELPNKYTRVIIGFEGGPTSSGTRRNSLGAGKPCLPAGRLFFNDLRIFGWIKVIKKNGKCSDLPELAKLGPEAIDEKNFTVQYLQQTLSRSKKPVKLVIMDQEKLAGVGNIYANETLFSAGIQPDRPANSLSEGEVKILRYWVLKTLKEAIGHKGTSDKDEAYRQISGEKGSFQNYLRVYGRAGQKCPNCEGTIKRIALGGRGTFYCPRCQK